ncbi:MAG: hypothetical protein JNJ57_14045 [Saprospiraceae bacterium]|nr:hypothetical protein [Saprospiraceae bacterium]
MRILSLIPVAFLLAGVTSLNAQMERTMYQVFEVDSAQVIELDIVGIYEVHTWAGSSILAEANIQIWDASPEILNFLIKEGRYDLTTDSTAGPTPKEMRIFTKNKERKPIKRPDGQKCLEIATTKLFIPDVFWVSEDKTRLSRKVPAPVEEKPNGGE